MEKLLLPLLLALKATSGLIDESLNQLDQGDPKLVSFIREKLLQPPPKTPIKVQDMDLTSVQSTGETILVNTALQAQYGQPEALDDLFQPLMEKDNTSQRFFIEAGAYDGVWGSNTLRFELNPLWSGLLVEPDSKHYEEARGRGRNAWTLPSCFSTKKRPETVLFDSAGLLGGIINEGTGAKPGVDFVQRKRKEVKMQCVPIYSVLLALGNPRVDFMSIDIEGTDLQVIQTIPFDKVDISVIMIEVNHIGSIFEGDNDTLRRFLHENGYVFYRRISIDDIYVKKDLLPLITATKRNCQKS